MSSTTKLRKASQIFGRGPVTLDAAEAAQVARWMQWAADLIESLESGEKPRYIPEGLRSREPVTIEDVREFLGLPQVL